MNFERIRQIAALNECRLWNVKVWQEVEIHERIKEWWNERIWRFKWLIIKVKKANSHDGTFTIRWKSLWANVEKVYPISTNIIEKIIILDEKKVRRAKLYFIRHKVWKGARLKSLLAWTKSSRRWMEIEKLPIKINLKEASEKTETQKEVKENNEVETSQAGEK